MIEYNVLCFLHAEEEPEPQGPDPEDSVREILPSYMDGGLIPGLIGEVGSKRAHIYGGGMLASKLAYVPSILFTQGSTELFIGGYTIESITPKSAVRFMSSHQQYIEIPDSRQYDHLSSGFTLSFDVKARVDSNREYQGIVVKPGVFETWVHPSGNSFGMRVNVGGTWYQALTTSYSRNRWYTLSFRHDGSTLRFFMNGQQFHSVNALGQMTHNSNPIYFGRYPQYNTHSDIDLANVKMWNYGLSNEEISSEYIAPYRSSCIPAHIMIQEPMDLMSHKRSHITSPLGPSNPGSVFSSQLAEFAENKQASSKRFFIVAGGEQENTWDTRFITDDTIRSSWDTLILVGNNRDRNTNIQLGSVVYPITREAIYSIRVPTTDDPLVSSAGIKAWLVAYHEGTSSKNAHIYVAEYTGSRKSVYLNGHFTSEHSSLKAFVNNTETTSHIDSFIEGKFVFRYQWSKLVFINSFSDNTTAQVYAGIEGSEGTTSSAQLYITAPAWTTNRASMFIMSLSDTIRTDGVRGYVQGNVGAARRHQAFIDGHYANESSQDSYISAIPITRSSVESFINSEQKYISWKDSHMRGWESLTSSKITYLKSGLSVSKSIGASLGGRSSFLRAHRVYVAGPSAIALEGVLEAFITNSHPVASKNAFIVSKPQSSIGCYIVSVGSSSRIKSTYIAA